MEIVGKQGLDKVVKEIKSDQQREYKLLGKFTPKIDGGSIYEYDLKGGYLKKAEMRQHDTATLHGVQPKGSIHIKPGKVYVEALNVKNALKRLKKKKVILIT